MNKLLIYIGIITVVSITACSNDNVVDNVIEKEQTLSFDKSLKFKNVVDSINKNCFMGIFAQERQELQIMVPLKILYLHFKRKKC